MCRAVAIFYMVGLVSFSCSAQQGGGMRGKVSVTMRMCDSATRQMDTIPYQKDPIIWYRDSLVIEEVFYTQFYQNDSTHEQTWKSLPYEYTFIDLPNRGFYVFSSFSDTATLVRKYTQPDSVQGTVDNFWGRLSGSELKNAQPLDDTVLDGVKYQLYSTKFYGFNQYRKPDSTTDIVYVACNTGRPKMFTLNKDFSERHQGCPVKRMDKHLAGQPYITVVDTLYLADKLTDREEKVFNAWAKYAKEHPIERQPVK